jgi:hypothetical protein
LSSLRHAIDEDFGAAAGNAVEAGATSRSITVGTGS